MSSTEQAAAAIRAGKIVILPTDTVYGLCTDAYRESSALRLARLKGRPDETPTALLATDLEAMLVAVPELRGSAEVVARALLPGAYTLVFPNPARRFPWLTGSRPDTIGIRIPTLPNDACDVVERVRVVAATSANAHGGPDPRNVADVPEELRDAAAAIVDSGELPGTPSTVVDLTGRRAAVLREGAVPAGEALRRIAAATR